MTAIKVNSFEHESKMRLKSSFFARDVLEVAPELLGKVMVSQRQLDDGRVEKFRGIICEVEAYRGEEDLACHARFGRTQRTEALYGEGGHIYTYLIYGMYWLLNIVTGQEGEPQGVLIRSIRIEGEDKEIQGPGRVGRRLGIDKGWYGEDATSSDWLWLEEGKKYRGQRFTRGERIGVAYAGAWARKPWRYRLLPGEAEA
jgi:DNA-3-methyladenine glycosylase